MLASALFGILRLHLFLLGSLSEKMKSKAYNQTHLLVFLFIIFFLTKLTVIKHLPLINDEAYTLTISRYFSLSYFDHPPLMMWISYSLHFLEVFQIHIFRVPFIVFGLLTSFFLYKITSKFYSKEAGTVSAILYFISPFFFSSGASKGKVIHPTESNGVLLWRPKKLAILLTLSPGPCSNR